MILTFPVARRTEFVMLLTSFFNLFFLTVHQVGLSNSEKTSLDQGYNALCESNKHPKGGDVIDTLAFQCRISNQCRVISTEKFLKPKQHEQAAGTVRSYVNTLRETENECTKRIQMFSVLDHGTHHSTAQLWFVQTRACPNIPRDVVWTTLRKVMEEEACLERGIFPAEDFSDIRNEDPLKKISEVNKTLHNALAQITSMASFVLNAVSKFKYNADKNMGHELKCFLVS